MKVKDLPQRCSTSTDTLRSRQQCALETRRISHLSLLKCAPIQLPRIITKYSRKLFNASSFIQLFQPFVFISLYSTKQPSTLVLPHLNLTTSVYGAAPPTEYSSLQAFLLTLSSHYQIHLDFTEPFLPKARQMAPTSSSRFSDLLTEVQLSIWKFATIPHLANSEAKCTFPSAYSSNRRSGPSYRGQHPEHSSGGLSAVSRSYASDFLHSLEPQRCFLGADRILETRWRKSAPGTRTKLMTCAVSQGRPCSRRGRRILHLLS